MAALAGIGWNLHLRAFYARLVACGKLKKVALVAVMRKRLIHLNATMRTASDAAAPAAPET